MEDDDSEIFRFKDSKLIIRLSVLKKGPQRWLFREYIRDEILPSYVGIIS